MVFVSYCEAWSKKVKKQYRTKDKTNKPTTQKRGQRGSLNLSKIKVVSFVWVPGVVGWCWWVRTGKERSRWRVLPLIWCLLTPTHNPARGGKSGMGPPWLAETQTEGRTKLNKRGAGSGMLFMLLCKPNTDLHEAGHLAQAAELFHPTPTPTPTPISLSVVWGGQQEPRAQTGEL